MPILNTMLLSAKEYRHKETTLAAASDSINTHFKVVYIKFKTYLSSTLITTFLFAVHTSARSL